MYAPHRDPNRPFSTRNLFPRHHGEREGGGPIAGIPSKAKRTWERYDAKKQRYLRLGKTNKWCYLRPARDL